jgi:hypothetical protein
MTDEQLIDHLPSNKLEFVYRPLIDNESIWDGLWGICKLSIQPDGELWMVRDDGRDTDGTGVWKTINGDGPRLLRSNFNEKINVLWDNNEEL